jgi:hypothetical protein
MEMGRHHQRTADDSGCMLCQGSEAAPDAINSSGGVSIYRTAHAVGEVQKQACAPPDHQNT